MKIVGRKDRVRAYFCIWSSAAVLLLLTGVPSYGQTGACCDKSDQTCTDGRTQTDCENDGFNYLGDSTLCGTTLDCPCDSPCADCVEKTSGGNPGTIQVKFEGSSFDGTNTTFEYRICHDPLGGGGQLSHFVLGLNDVCCSICPPGGPAPGDPICIVSTSGGSPQGCGTDPTTQLFGFKFDTGAGVLDCDGVTCGGGGTLFTITLSGNVPEGCLKEANKIDGPPSTAIGCVPGPECKIPPCEKCETFDPGTGMCVKNPGCCASDAQCGKCEACDLLTNTCFKVGPPCCASDAQCPAKCEVCDITPGSPTENTCVLAQPGCCVDNLDCGKCETCEPTPDPNVNKCVKNVPNCCTDDTQCPNKCEACDLQSNTCFKVGPPCCASDTQCPNKCEVCDLVSNTCVLAQPVCSEYNLECVKC